MISKPLRGTVLKPDHSLSRGVKRAWLFNAFNGDIIFDSSGVRDTGDAVNNPLWIAGSLDFDGVDQRVEATGGNIVQDDRAWSFAIRFNLDTIATDQYFAQFGSGALMWHARYRVSNNRLYFQNNNTGGSNIVQNIFLSIDTWYTLIISAKVGDLTDVEFYLDGIKLTPLDNSATGYSGNDDILYVGSGSGNYINGQVDYFYLWDRQLNDIEAKRISADPYQIFQQLDYGFLTSAAGASTCAC